MPPEPSNVPSSRCHPSVASAGIVTSSVRVAVSSGARVTDPWSGKPAQPSGDATSYATSNDVPAWLASTMVSVACWPRVTRLSATYRDATSAGGGAGGGGGLPCCTKTLIHPYQPAYPLEEK